MVTTGYDDWLKSEVATWLWLHHIDSDFCSHSRDLCNRDLVNQVAATLVICATPGAPGRSSVPPLRAALLVRVAVSVPPPPPSPYRPRRRLRAAAAALSVPPPSLSPCRHHHPLHTTPVAVS